MITSTTKRRSAARRYGYYVGISLVLISAIWPAPSVALDGSRRGFNAGAGIGAGFLFTSTNYIDPNDLRIARASHTPVMMNILLGYAPTDRLLLYIEDKRHYYHITEIVRSGEYTDRIRNSVTGLACRWYASAGPHSWFLSGGAGLSTQRTTEGGDANTGIGVIAGIGYEIHTHFNIETAATWGHTSRHFGHTFKREIIRRSWTIGVTLNVLAY